MQNFAPRRFAVRHFGQIKEPAMSHLYSLAPQRLQNFAPDLNELPQRGHFVWSAPHFEQNFASERIVARQL
jgi:hypothetical protein